MSRKINKPNHPPLYMLDQQITEVDSHLGVYFSNDCSWHRHIKYIKDKAWSRINVMRKLKFKLDRKSLETIYLTCIRPILEYGDVVWNNCTQYEKEELEKIQTEAARIATGATKFISLNALFREIQRESLQDRRHNHQLTLFYKMHTNLAPEHLTSLVPQPVGAASRYNLRNAYNLQTITTRTNLYYQSFLPSAIRSWNNLQYNSTCSEFHNRYKTFLACKIEQQRLLGSLQLFYLSRDAIFPLPRFSSSFFLSHKLFSKGQTGFVFFYGFSLCHIFTKGRIIFFFSCVFHFCTKRH